VKVLVVDDDQMVLSVCSAMLNVMQHEAVTVASGAEALEHLALNESRFDLILLDESMPGMSGRETLLQLRALGIRIPVVIFSGKNVAVEEFAASADPRPAAVLSKPFTLRSLQSALIRAFPD
jgi:CheY-like chemotaxis protein